MKNRTRNFAILMAIVLLAAGIWAAVGSPVVSQVRLPTTSRALLRPDADDDREEGEGYLADGDEDEGEFEDDDDYGGGGGILGNLATLAAIVVGALLFIRVATHIRQNLRRKAPEADEAP